MKTLMLMAASAALFALFAPETGSGGGSGASGDLLKSDPAPQPLTGDRQSSAEPQPDPKVGAVGNAENADVNAPSSSKDAETTTAGAAAEAKRGSGKKAASTVEKAADPQAGVKRAYMVWVQPGHETLGVGQMIAVPTAQADVLRGAGRARFASEAEVQAAKESEHSRDILVLDGI